MAMSIEDIAVSWVDAGYNKRQIGVNSWARRLGIEKSYAIFVLSVLDNVASQHWPPQRNKFPFCQNAFHKAHHNTNCHTPEKRRYSIVGLAVLVPGRFVGWKHFFQGRHPNWAGNELLDLPLSGCRFCFFLFQKSIQLIQFCHFGLLRHWYRRQFRDIAIDPIWGTLRTNFQNSSNRPLATTFHIHAQRQHTGFPGIPFLLCPGGVGSLTFSTLIALAAWVIEPGFHLTPICSTVWTLHLSILLPVLDTPYKSWDNLLSIPSHNSRTAYVMETEQKLGRTRG